MSKARIIQADYANWRPVAGRKVLQLVFEVPIEQTADVMEKLGVPMPGESRWCAIALLNASSEKTSCAQREPASPGKQQRNTVGVTAGETATKDRKPFASLPLSQQAAIRCQDKTFRDFISRRGASGLGEWTPEMAADMVRTVCKISSRSELDRGVCTPCRNAWLQLEDDYQSWLTTQRYAEARRG